MPQLPRIARETREPRAAPPAPRVAEPTVREQLRVRCPCCGMMPEVERIENGPYEVRLYLQRFGGRRPAPPGIPSGKRSRQAPGFMDYADISEDRPGELESQKERIRQRLALILESL